MYFYFNNKKIYSKQNFSIRELLAFLDINVGLITLEYNSFVYPKEFWVNTIIKNQDKITIVTIVGGG